jgi:hypothetical protein
MKYAIIDSFYNSPGHGEGWGFVNTKFCLAFDSLAERKEFLQNRKNFDFGAKEISARDARKWAVKISTDYGYFYGIEKFIKKAYKEGRKNFDFFGEDVYKIFRERVY